MSILCFLAGMLKENFSNDRFSSEGKMLISGIFKMISSLVMKYATNPHIMHDWCNVPSGIVLALSIFGAALEFILWLCLGSDRTEGPEKLMLIGAGVSTFLSFITGFIHYLSS